MAFSITVGLQRTTLLQLIRVHHGYTKAAMHGGVYAATKAEMTPTWNQDRLGMDRIVWS